jgi:hypothetical protein
MSQSEKTIEKSLAIQILEKMQEYLKGAEYFDDKYLTKLNRFISNEYITSEEQLIKILTNKEEGKE